MAATKRYDVKALALAAEGKRRIEWADRQMPVLAAIRDRGLHWTARYFVRRTAWHVLDHLWEIEDRL